MHSSPNDDGGLDEDFLQAREREMIAETMICAACLRRTGPGPRHEEPHKDCLYMVFDVSHAATGGEPVGMYARYERAALLAYASACSKDLPEVARLIRLRIRLKLGRELRIVNLKGRIFVTERSEREVLDNTKVVCGRWGLEHGARCNLLAGHKGQHAEGRYNPPDATAKSNFMVVHLWGLTESERRAYVKAKKKLKSKTQSGGRTRMP